MVGMGLLQRRESRRNTQSEKYTAVHEGVSEDTKGIAMTEFRKFH
jgi:hypothetical protein